MNKMPKVDSLKTSHNPTYSFGIHEKPFFHYSMAFLTMAIFIMSLFALIYTIQLKKAILPETVNVNEFLKSLTSHPEMKSYIGVAPLNVIEVNNNNLASLQAQISGIDSSYIGNFIVQYSDRIVVYDYHNDNLRGTATLQQAQQPQLPSDFISKLNMHQEIKGLENQKPVGGQLDQNSLSILKSQFPEVYQNAKVGDFLLRYQTKLIIYDYAQDKIVNVVNLG